MIGHFLNKISVVNICFVTYWESYIFLKFHFIGVLKFEMILTNTVCFFSDNQIDVRVEEGLGEREWERRGRRDGKGWRKGNLSLMKA